MAKSDGSLTKKDFVNKETMSDVIQTSGGLSLTRRSILDEIRYKGHYPGPLPKWWRKITNKQKKKAKRYSTASKELRRLRRERKLQRVSAKFFFKYGMKGHTGANVAVLGSVMSHGLSSLATSLARERIPPLDWNHEISGLNARDVILRGNLGLVVPPNLPRQIIRLTP